MEDINKKGIVICLGGGLATLIGILFVMCCVCQQLKSNVSSPAKSTGYVDFCINGQTLRLDLEKTAPQLEVPSLNCEADISVSYTGSECYQVTFDGILLNSGMEIPYRVRRLDPNDAITISVMDEGTGAVNYYSLATWPSAIPTYSVVGRSSYEGDYYLTLIASINNVAMKVGTNGELLYYNYNPYGCLADFKKVNTKDGVRYLLFTTKATQYKTRGVTQSGEYIVMDSSYHEIKRLSMAASTHILADGYPVDQHDCKYISDDEYYLITYADENVYNIPDEIPHKENGSLVSAAIYRDLRMINFLLSGPVRISLSFMRCLWTIMIIPIVPVNLPQTICI